MMSIKNGFRGDWATLLKGSSSKFAYYIYDVNGNRSSLYENKTYDELAGQHQIN